MTNNQKDNTLYSIVGYRSDKTTKVIAEHVSFEEGIRLTEKYHKDFINVSIIEEKFIPWTPSNLFVVSDANGLYHETRELLYRPIHLKETFVFLGNFIGSHNFKEYADYLLMIANKRQCVFVSGLNEYNLLQGIHQTYNYLGSPELAETFNKLVELDLGYSLEQLPKKFPSFYKVLMKAPHYYENDEYIFVPGGLDLSIPYWKQSDLSNILITTDDFIKLKNRTGKKIVFGYKPVQDLSDEPVYGIWRNYKGNKIGINGDCQNLNKLIGFSILNGETNYFTVRSREGRRRRLIANYEKYKELDDLDFD